MLSRQEILQKLSSGELTVDEAQKLLLVLDLEVRVDGKNFITAKGLKSKIHLTELDQIKSLLPTFEETAMNHEIELEAAAKAEADEAAAEAAKAPATDTKSEETPAAAKAA